MVKNLPIMQETQVWSLGLEDPLEEGLATHSSILAQRIPMDRGAWQATVHRVTKSQARLNRLTMQAWVPLKRCNEFSFLVSIPVWWLSACFACLYSTNMRSLDTFLFLTYYLFTSIRHPCEGHYSFYLTTSYCLLACPVDLDCLFAPWLSSPWPTSTTALPSTCPG